MCAKQVEYKSQIKITLRAEGPWVKSTHVPDQHLHISPVQRTAGQFLGTNEQPKQQEGAARTAQRKVRGVSTLWAQGDAVKGGRRQEALDAMAMGRVHRPTQAGTTLPPAIFEAGGSCLCIPRDKKLS